MAENLQEAVAQARETLKANKLGASTGLVEALAALIERLTPGDYEYGVYVGGGCVRPEDDVIDDLAVAVDRMHELAVVGTERAKAGGYSVDPVQLVAYTREALAMNAGAAS